MRSSEIIRIDPRDLITPPFEDCAACGSSRELGLVSVTARGYRKRCRVCMADQTFDLPPLANKRVLYLDQMAISNLLKSTQPEHRHKFVESNPATHSGFWPRLLERLERLVHLNLLVCPRSSVHDIEAAFDDRMSGSLRSFHEQLAGDVRFQHHSTVERFQLEGACRAWLDKHQPEPLDRRDVLEGRLDAWLDRFLVNAYHPITPEEISVLRDRRERVDARLQQFFADSRQESRRSFDDFLGEQLWGYGPALSGCGYLSELMIGLRARMEKHGVPQELWSRRITAFLHSEAPRRTSYAEIISGMLAALAWRASRNQLARPTQGLRADLQAISTYLPYADAMFVDNECARLLRQAPLNTRLPCQTRVFSLASRTELLDWLRVIEDDAPGGHVELVERVYGPTWLQSR